VRLSAYLDPGAEEASAREAHAWIKSLRRARVGGLTFRERFTYRGDSLWWFAELYLHKEREVLGIFRAIHAAQALFDREAPATIRLERGDGVAAVVLPQLAAARGVGYEGPRPPRRGRLVMDARSTALMLAALASPGRPAQPPPMAGATVAAFVHRAFWRGAPADGSAESYIGPVLQALEARLPAGGVRYVGVGPSTNFRARRWWRTGAAPGAGVPPIEALVPRASLAGSSGVWAARHAMRRAMEGSADLRSAALINGCDCWAIVAGALAGVALLQFPWSARAMDEAGAALDAVRPAVAVTYAEAGGWGRALALEARRRRIPLAGLQHGFIYRHWLNYLHEADEMGPSAPGSPDAGFPLPTATLLFDEYAARHLREAGRFPAPALPVTGSPRLDQLAAAFRDLDAGAVAAARAAAGAEGGRALVLLVTKNAEARHVLPPLLDAVRQLPDVQLAIKAHPAETPAPYEAAAAGIPNVTVLPATAALAPLLRASRALVTVNSTVALDGLALGVPAMTIGLPNNLSPFVEAGAIAGAGTPDEMGGTLRRLLYDEGFRQRLIATAATLVAEYRMAPDGGAADRSASAVLELVGPPRNQE
jgi:hypothetical protein